MEYNHTLIVYYKKVNDFQLCDIIHRRYQYFPIRLNSTNYSTFIETDTNGDPIIENGKYIPKKCPYDAALFESTHITLTGEKCMRTVIGMKYGSDGHTHKVFLQLGDIIFASINADYSIE